MNPCVGDCVCFVSHAYQVGSGDEPFNESRPQGVRGWAEREREGFNVQRGTKVVSRRKGFRRGQPDPELRNEVAWFSSVTYWNLIS